MHLRHHPLMIYLGVRNWPPAWLWRGGGGESDDKPRGEIGTLKDVFLSNIEPRSQCFLIMEHNGNEYLGCLMFSDAMFCIQVHDLLKLHCGDRIADVGSLDVSHLL